MLWSSGRSNRSTCGYAPCQTGGRRQQRGNRYSSDREPVALSFVSHFSPCLVVEVLRSQKCTTIFLNLKVYDIYISHAEHQERISALLRSSLLVHKCSRTAVSRFRRNAVETKGNPRYFRRRHRLDLQNQVDERYLNRVEVERGTGSLPRLTVESVPMHCDRRIARQSECRRMEFGPTPVRARSLSRHSIAHLLKEYANSPMLRSTPRPVTPTTYKSMNVPLRDLIRSTVASQMAMNYFTEDMDSRITFNCPGRSRFSTASMAFS
jgi:hypothetical protein